MERTYAIIKAELKKQKQKQKLEEEGECTGESDEEEAGEEEAGEEEAGEEAGEEEAGEEEAGEEAGEEEAGNTNYTDNTNILILSGGKKKTICTDLRKDFLEMSVSSKLAIFSDRKVRSSSRNKQ